MDNSGTSEGRVEVRCTIPGGMICSMSYRLVLIVGTPANFSSKPNIMLEDIVSFDVLPRFYDNRYPLNLSGAIPLNLDWTIKAAPTGRAPSSALPKPGPFSDVG